MTSSVELPHHHSQPNGLTQPNGFPPHEGFLQPNCLMPGNGLMPGHGVMQPILHNRIRAVIFHIPWYAFKTQARLARDSAISEAAISRLIRGKCQPSLTLALKVTKAIERRLDCPLNLWELFSLDGTYPTASVCELVGCRNCLPAVFYEGETIKPQFSGHCPSPMTGAVEGKWVKGKKVRDKPVKSN